MGKKFLFFCISVFVVSVSSAQLTKGNWLVGGDIRANFNKQGGSLGNVTQTEIAFNPNLAYFIADRLAIGIKPSFGFSHINSNGVISKVTNYGIGPNIRYYFLKPEKQVNILADLRYQYLNTTKGDFERQVYGISVGPAIFFNSSVALEITANYQGENYGKNSITLSNLFIAIGLQVHLKKE